MFNSMHAQSEITRRQAFVSSGMQDVRLIRSYVAKLVRRFRNRLGKISSEKQASPKHQAFVSGRYAQG